MATLERIRNRAGLLVSIVIGLALMAFILGDLFRGGTNLSSDQFEIAEINGVSIDQRNYQNRLDEAMENAKRNSDQSSLDERTMNQVRNQVWQQLLQEKVMGEEIGEAGINVSVEELNDMVTGNNIHPQIRQIPIFQNEQTGQFDPQLVKRFIASFEQNPEARESWLAFEQGIKQQRINTKYYTAVQKGLFATDLQARQTAVNKQRKVDFKYVAMAYTELKDEEIAIEKADLEKYYNEHKKLFEQEKSVNIEYVTFPIEPSQEDINNIRKDIESLVPELKETDEEAQFVTATSDQAFDPKFYKKGEYSNPLIDSLMFTKEEGFIYGPYREGESFKVAKIAQIETRPDTIKIRHIVLVPGEQRDGQQTQQLADSLTQLIENGADFAQLAQKHSDDKETAVKGGNTGWKNPEEIVYGNALLDAGVGEIVKFPTQQAVLIAEMTEKGKEVKQVQLAVISRDITPSEETNDIVYRKASEFAGNHRTFKSFNKGVEDNANLTKKQANNLKSTSREIAGLGIARNLIREAFFTESEQIIVDRSSQSPIFEINDNYVIGVVTEKRDKGYAPLEQVRATVERAVKKEKKAELLKEKINKALSNSNNIDELAQSLGTEVKETQGASFAAFSVPGLGMEPKVQGVASVLEANEISAPIQGNNAVYVLQVTNVQEAGENQNLAMEKKAIERTYVSRAQNEVFEALKDNAEIEDNRIKFY